jgi:hypothetical protein
MLLLVIVICAGGYLISLRIHPLGSCPECRRAGRYPAYIGRRRCRRHRPARRSGVLAAAWWMVHWVSTSCLTPLLTRVLTTEGSMRLLRLAAVVMPRAAARQWLAVAESILSEVAEQDRKVIACSFLITAPLVIAAAWRSKLSRRAAAGDEPPRAWHDDG